MNDLNYLYQAKARDRKYFITDIAIEKVPFIQYRNMNTEQNKNMQLLAKLVLKLAKENNESNEVAVTWDISSKEVNKYGIAYGTENTLDVEADTYTYHLLHSGNERRLVLLHNHPSTRIFSLDDINFFLYYYTLEYMVVVSNQGTIHYLKKEKDYNLHSAKILYNECVIKHKAAVTIDDKYAASLEFLKRCSETGIYFQ